MDNVTGWGFVAVHWGAGWAGLLKFESAGMAVVGAQAVADVTGTPTPVLALALHPGARLLYGLARRPRVTVLQVWAAVCRLPLPSLGPLLPWLPRGLRLP